jgi:hypothetical protein
MKTCEECGLPIPVCNALALYRRSHGYLLRERYDDAKDAAISAHEEYERFRANGQTARVDK